MEEQFSLHFNVSASNKQNIHYELSSVLSNIVSEITKETIDFYYKIGHLYHDFKNFNVENQIDI